MIKLVPSLASSIEALPAVYSAIKCSFQNRIAFHYNQEVQGAFELWVNFYFLER